MTRTIGRIAFAAVAWLFLIGIVAQVFLAGVGLFVPGIDMFAAHRQLGWLLHAGPLLVLPLAWAAGADRRTIWLSAALFVLVAFQPFLPGMRTDAPFVAALHPLNAMLIFGLSAVIARRSVLMLRSATAPLPDAVATPPPTASETPVTH